MSVLYTPMIREMTPDDVARAVEVNAMNLIDVDAITVDRLATVLASSRVALVAIEPAGSIVGLCIVVDDSCGYLSDRARWALSTGDLHIDRVVFDMNFSGFGLGLAIYNELDRRIDEIAAAQPSRTITLTSLVRVDPPNQHSIGFHAKRGFEPIDRANFDGTMFELTRRTY